MRLRALLKRPAYIVLVVISYSADLVRYIASASVIFFHDSERKITALIRKDNHRIEKGLALPEPRLWFGEPVLARLVTNIQKYCLLKTVDLKFLDESHAVLKEYTEYFSPKAAVPPTIKQHLSRLDAILGSRAPVHAGTIEICRDDIFKRREESYSEFVKSRYSVRQFNGAPISDEVVGRAIDLAIKTPSVCNRCAWKVYNVASPSLRAKVLACQNGNAGFGDTCGNVLIVAMDLRCFEGGGERNQAYVDGGLFAMSLMYALHDEGVASCFLNWSAHYFQDRKLRKLLDIPNYEVIITFIGIGGYPKKLRVAASPRPNASDILKNI